MLYLVEMGLLFNCITSATDKQLGSPGRLSSMGIRDTRKILVCSVEARREGFSAAINTSVKLSELFFSWRGKWCPVCLGSVGDQWF